MNSKRLFSLVAAVCSVVSLSACDLMGDPNGGDCHIDSEYRIRCDGPSGPEIHEPNSN